MMPMGMETWTLECEEFLQLIGFVLWACMFSYMAFIHFRDKRRERDKEAGR